MGYTPVYCCFQRIHYISTGIQHQTMKKTMITLGAASFLIAACHTTKVLTEADATRGSAKYPGLTVSDLQQGKADYEKYCSTCHGLKKPRKQSPEEWEKIVPGMAKRAAKKPGKEIPEAAQQSILKYLTTMSTR